MQAELLNLKGEKVGKVDLKEDLFGVKPSKSFLHEYVTVYLANQRQHDANTKGRGEVSGGGKKPWKQKGTGRARSGSTRSGLWRHGGIIFGPKSKDIYLDFPRQKSRKALTQALAARHADGGIVFVDKLELAEARTKLMAAALATLGCAGRTILVLDQPNANITRAARNIPNLEVRLAGDLNAYEVLRSRKLVLTQPALEKLEARAN